MTIVMLRTAHNPDGVRQYQARGGGGGGAKGAGAAGGAVGGVGHKPGGGGKFGEGQQGGIGADKDKSNPDPLKRGKPRTRR